MLAAVTAATPKIADYPFTTLEPNLGVMDLGDEDERRPTIADVPGLIEGASSGAGLGHAFLRHVERTRVLVHVIDGSSRDPEWDYDVIRERAGGARPGAAPEADAGRLQQDRPVRPRAKPGRPSGARGRREGLDVVAISADDGEGLPAFRARIAAILPSAAELAGPPEPSGVVVHRVETMDDGFSIDHDADGAFRVRGRRIERAAAQTNFDVEESAERFQRDLARLGIDAELRRAGIAAGDTVRIGSTELEWEAQPWERV